MNIVYKLSAWLMDKSILTSCIEIMNGLANSLWVQCKENDKWVIEFFKREKTKDAGSKKFGVVRFLDFKIDNYLTIIN